MKEKELRIALVCFGGVSLAVYMHGITKEILKLTRASAALHAIRDRGERANAVFSPPAGEAAGEYDTEACYFELLREIGRRTELRVIVDIIAGASAGGINGAMLSRALCHDLPMQSLRDLWLDNADVTVLLDPAARAGRWSKWFLRPLIWFMGRTSYLAAIKDPEVRAKLSLFVRSRWFKPPLSGARMSALMYQAAIAMGSGNKPDASLLPAGQPFDLFITLTDHYGYQQIVQIHDPPLIHEREHRHVLRFSYRRNARGAVESQFDLDNAPALAFAARATSSFPGAFPPTRIVEMDKLLAERGEIWPRREEFLAINFERYRQWNIDPTTACFVDGSVLNNRPFREAIGAIRGRPAYREVDRRLVYIDPDPAAPATITRHRMPGFFSTLKGALSDIPSSEPVVDELSWVSNFNDRVRRIRSIVEEARPRVSRLVEGIVNAAPDQAVTAVQVRAWREEVHEQVKRDAGFAYEGYVRLKLASVRDFVSNLIASLRGVPPQSPLARAIAEVIDAWSTQSGTAFQADDGALANFERGSAELPVAPWVKFLLTFDVDYRRRRLHFLIEGQNRLYDIFGRQDAAGFDRGVVDRLKRLFYEKLDILNRYEQAAHFSKSTLEQAEKLFPTAPSARDARDLKRHAALFVQFHGERLAALIDRLGQEIGLDSNTEEIDHLLAAMAPARWHPAARREVLINYLGFPFWDVLTFPVMSWREAGEFNEILVDRISPLDAHTLGPFSGAGSLMGVGFGHFAGFFSRSFREKDYLLGRLHGLDRLIDIVSDSAELDPERGGVDLIALKKRAFTRILETEEPHLPNSASLFEALRRCIDELGEGAKRNECTTG